MAIEDESFLEHTDRPNLFALIGVLVSGASLSLLGCACNPILFFLFIPVGGILSSISLAATWAGFQVARQTGRGRDLAQWGAYIGVFTLLTWTGLGLAIFLLFVASALERA